MKSWNKKVHFFCLAAIVTAFLCIASFQLELPGLHYDEAKEAGVNAVELLYGRPVTAFRGATVSVFGFQFPLMVQDYIGALNVYLALPLLAATEINVPNLRIVSLFLAVLGLLALERSVSEWFALIEGNRARVAPIVPAALVCLMFLAVAPSFVFWQRQGIYVTNATIFCTFTAVWSALSWLRHGRRRALLLATFCAGLALYAKLLAVWIIAPLIVGSAGWWLWRRSRGAIDSVADQHSHRTSSVAFGRESGGSVPLPFTWFVYAVLAFLLPLSPFLLFNLQTGGTWASISRNLTTSYFGVDNTAIFGNLITRLLQVQQILDGSHLWYLGAIHSNPLLPWIALVLPTVTLLHVDGRRMVGPPLLLLAATLVGSLFTVSGLHVTHYALVHPLVVAVTSVGLHFIWKWSATCKEPEAAVDLPNPSVRSTFAIRPLQWLFVRDAEFVGRGHWTRYVVVRCVLVCLVALSIVLDLRATLAYHRALSISGGLGDHSNASYQLASDLLNSEELGELIVLDWGMAAQIRYLSKGRLNPIEIFGYASMHEPDDDFSKRLELYLHDEAHVYLLRDPSHEVFRGRRAVFENIAAEYDRCLSRQKIYFQGDGTPLYEQWRVLVCPY